MTFVNRDLYDEASARIKIRSLCDWYEFGEKSNNFVLKLRKTPCLTKYS